MATTARLPLSQRSRASLASPRPTKASSGLKRPRSPVATLDDQQHQVAVKRAKPAPETPSEKQRRKDQQEIEWREKYTRAFRGWKFHFSNDIQDTEYVKTLEKRIIQLGAVVDDFFSASITHLVVKDVEQAKGSDKENRYGHKSPSKQRVILVPEVPQVYLATVQQNNIKEWGVRKLDSVLSRCLLLPLILPTSGPLPSKLMPTHSHAGHSRSLTKLLQSEKIHGTTERDPNQKRHEYTYFARGSYFVLVEDVREELATIVAHQYMPPRKGSSRTPWPVLHCHPQSRGPFVPFDEREKKRWEKAQRIEKEDKEEAQERELQEQILLKERISRQRERRNNQGGLDLRRSVSMNNLRRESLDAENTNECYLELDSACASGYLASGNGGYVAASGNSVSITSTTGTTSTAGHNFNSNLSAKLRAFADHQVPTSRKAGGRRDSIKGDMGPPALPEGRVGIRRAKSTNNLKLPKRDEGSKPGYCESCRVKFDDFKQHICSNKHRRFAMNAAHFAELDHVLDRVKRRSKQEIMAERRASDQAPIDIEEYEDEDYDDPVINKKIMMPDVDLDDD